MIKICIVGTGGIGTVHYNNYLHIEGCEVVALVDKSDTADVKAKEWKLPLFSTISEMVGAVDVDVIDICTPTFLHKGHVMLGLKAGKDIIVEKPLALCSVDVSEIFALADSVNKNVYVAHVLQFTKEINELRQLVQSKKYGRVLDAQFERMTACPKWVSGGWLFDKEKSGLLPFDLHIHDLDVIVSLFGEPTNTVVSSSKREDANFEDHYRIFYHYENFNVVAQASWFHANFPFTVKWRVVFENAVLDFSDGNLMLYPYEAEPFKISIEDEIIIPTGINIPPTGWFYNELSHFVDCIRNKIPTPFVTREQLISTVKILENLY